MRRINRGELPELAEAAGFRLAEGEVDEFFVLTEAMFESLDRVEQLPDAEMGRLEDILRDPGQRPSRQSDPFNAITRWCSVRARQHDGPLSGVRVALKDMIAVAGVPMTFGSHAFRDYVPDEDAELTKRLLQSGAEIVAITNMEALAFSAGGETCCYGPVRNPFDLERTACGSSGGSAAALYYDDIDLSWGTDTGGSIRIPASWCGVLGLKPTHGLVPFDGIPTTDGRFDHAGPMARSVLMLARGLDAVVQAPLVDPTSQQAAAQQPGLKAKPEYVRSVEDAPNDLQGYRLGLVEEALTTSASPGAPAGSKETLAATHEAVERLRALGAVVEPVAIPEFTTAADVMFAAMIESATSAALGWPSFYNWKGDVSPSFLAGQKAGRALYADELPPTFKLILILGVHLNRIYGGAVTARAQRLVRPLNAAIDARLGEFDFLVMPTTTHYAHQIKGDASLSEMALRGWGMLSNAPAFNATGHPGLSIPAASADGLPVGIMLVGRHFDDANLLRFARSYEREYGWEPAFSTDGG